MNRTGYSILIAVGLGAMGLFWFHERAQPIKAAKIHLGAVGPNDIVGLAGKPLGSLVRIAGNVTETDGNEFKIMAMVGEAKEHEFTCKMDSHGHAATVPAKGQAVAVVGYEAVEQRGFNDDVGQYLMTRTDILNSAHNEKHDYPGGDGPSRFENVIVVIDIPYKGG